MRVALVSLMTPGRTFRKTLLPVICIGLLTMACEARQTAPSRAVAAVADASSNEKDIDAKNGSTTIFVTSNGWHSSFVVPSASLPPGTIPEAADFPDALYLSFGWGDAKFYPAREPTVGAALRAAIGPTKAVLHLAGLRAHPADVFPQDEVVALRISANGFRGLIGYLDDSFDRDGATRARTIAPGLHAFSRFYRATGQFHLFNTCNTWTARGLDAAGWTVQVNGIIAAEDLMLQVRQLAAQRNTLRE